MMKRNAFTLIELLIVVAIIAILAAIAVPNFLDAQMRAKISRVKADTRTMCMAAEIYRMDTNKYPAPYPPSDTWDLRQARLTTPQPYLASLPKDPFTSIHKHNPNMLLDFEVRGMIDDVWFTQHPRNPILRTPIDLYIRSFGPDKKEEQPMWSLDKSVYDPSNGTVSGGDVWALLPGQIYYPN